MEQCRVPVEIGVWLEVTEPLCQAAGIPWRGGRVLMGTGCLLWGLYTGRTEAVVPLDF